MKKTTLVVTKKRILDNKNFLVTFLVTENKYKVSPKNSFNDVYFENLEDALNHVNN